MSVPYADSDLKLEELQALPGATVLEFGTNWCGHCRAAEPIIAAALQHHPGVRHIKVADASGKRLGRAFGVKLWPTLIVLKEGKQAARFVRPRDARALREALAQLGADTSA